MNAAQRPNPAPFSGLQTPPDDGKRRRNPPKAIQLLVPVWGTAYTSQFLEVSLPTLLSPGNLPTLAKELPSKVVFLTSSTDATDLNDHAAIQYLRRICDVEINVIDDLITGDNYSTTITLAYTRAVRATGDAMLDTCFFFMISDYIVADGSLANVLARMQAGYSGVVAGNFQVVEESAKESYFKTFDSGKPNMIVRSRELMQWALAHLHPMTLANMVNFPLCHTTHTNRLFWRVDDNTLIGRFYLMHMICIRPEVTNFVVGSSCDYSFIPEMCPSGNVHVATDSDDYLVVEMQKRSHERDLVRFGSVKQSVLAASLIEWTTATHRKNAHSAVIFHALDIPPQAEESVVQSAAYIDEVERSLPRPQPHRNHPYWLGAMVAHEWSVTQREKSAMPLTAADLLEFRTTGLTRWLYQIRNFVYGRPPNVRPWHPRWPDYRMFSWLARRHFGRKKGKLLILSSAPAVFANFLNDVSPSAISLDLNHFLRMSRVQYQPMMRKFEGCLVVIDETQIGRMHELLRRVNPLFLEDGTLVVFAVNGYGAQVGPWFSVTMLQGLEQFFDHDMLLDEALFVPVGFGPWVALRGMQAAFAVVQRNWLWMPIESAVVAFLTIVSLLGNLGRSASPEPPRNQACSSLGLVMHKVVDRPFDLESIDPTLLKAPAQRFLWNWAAAEQDAGSGRQSMSAKK
jgi:hypothetical protein